MMGDMLVRGLVGQEGHAVLGAVVFENHHLVTHIDAKGGSVRVLARTGFRMDRGATVCPRGLSPAPLMVPLNPDAKRRYCR